MQPGTDDELLQRTLIAYADAGTAEADDELLGSDAQVTIVMVDLFEVKSEDPNTCTARKRDWSVIPDTEGDGTDALIYKGSFKAAGEIIKGTATTTDSWQTCTFTAE